MKIALGKLKICIVPLTRLNLSLHTFPQRKFHGQIVSIGNSPKHVINQPVFYKLYPRIEKKNKGKNEHLPDYFVRPV